MEKKKFFHVLFLMSSSCSASTCCDLCEFTEAVNRGSQRVLSCLKTNHKRARTTFGFHLRIVKSQVDMWVELNFESRVTCESVHALQLSPSTNSLASDGC